MIPIEKRNDKGCRITLRYQKSDDFSWASFGSSDKSEVRNLLYEEQRGLCAYCMCALPGASTGTRIDHFVARSHSGELTFDYSNLFLSCDTRQIPNARHCDEAKADTEFSVELNPALWGKRYSPPQFSYVATTGRIDSSDKRGQELIRVLNLNDPSLSSSRRTVMESKINQLMEIKRRVKSSSERERRYRKLKDTYSAGFGKNIAYYGAVQYILDRFIR